MNKAAEHVVLDGGEAFTSQAVAMNGDNFVQIEAWLVSATAAATGAGGLKMTIDRSNDLNTWESDPFGILSFGSGSVAPEYKKEPTSGTPTYARYVRLRVENLETSIRFMFNANLTTFQLSI